MNTALDPDDIMREARAKASHQRLPEKARRKRAGYEPIDKSVPARHQFPSVYIVGGRIVTDYAEFLELWRAGRIMANDEFRHIDSGDDSMPF